MAKLHTQTSDLCGSETPVEVGAMRYVGRTDEAGKCVAHVATGLAGERRVYDPEVRGMVTIHMYLSRPATPAEEAAYLLMPRAICETWRAGGEG